MAKPRINKIKPFDAGFDQMISFSWSGNQSFGNRVIIYDSETMSAVFDNTVKSFSYYHTIPADTLINGKCYIVQCQVYDVEWIESNISDKYYFNTLKTPVFNFVEMPGNTIRNSSYSTSVTYYQENFELLHSYKFAIYDSSKTLLSESDTIYDPDDLSYTFRGLQNDTEYLIRCYGVTVNGMDVDTGYVKVFVTYESPGVYSRLYAECDYDNGCVNYHTNINIIQPSESGDTDFEYEDSKIILLGKTLIYDEGFCIEKDFTLKLNGTGLFRNGDIITLKNDKTWLKITAYIYDDSSIRYKLIVPNAVSQYILYSDPLFCSSVDKITIVLRRINNLYQIAAYHEGGA